MDINDYIRIVRRNWALIAVGCLLGILTAGTVSLVAKPTYTAYTELFVATQGSDSVAELQQGNTFTQARVQSYVQTVSTPAVLQPVVDQLGLDATADDLSTRVTASADPNTVLITIAAVDTSPVQAAAVAQSVGESLVETVETLEKPAGADASPVKLSVVRPAIAPLTPSSPDIARNLILGTLLGLVVGLGAAFMRGTLDTRMRGESDLRRVTDAPLLGGIAYDLDAAKKPLLTQIQGQSPRAEAFRQIRTNLQFAHVGHRSKTVLVTSSLPGEGKSTTATNMAIALAQAGKTVCLVDADLRRPMVADYLGLERNAGLTTVLLGTAPWNELTQPWGEDELHVLTSGVIPPNPSELLGSGAMAQLIKELDNSFDAVIIDAPPLIPVTDAAVLAQQVGGVVLVAGAGKIKTQDLQKATDSLSLVNADILGIIINLLPAKGPDAYAYSYYSYESKPEIRRKPRAINGSHMKATRRPRTSAEPTIDTFAGPQR